MARAIYPHELSDPDFSWLINSFRESNPGYILIESGSLPMVLICESEERGPFGLLQTQVPRIEDENEGIKLK